MARKTAIRRLLKRLPMSTDRDDDMVHRVAARDDDWTPARRSMPQPVTPEPETPAETRMDAIEDAIATGPEDDFLDVPAAEADPHDPERRAELQEMLVSLIQPGPDPSSGVDALHWCIEGDARLRAKRWPPWTILSARAAAEGGIGGIRSGLRRQRKMRTVSAWPPKPAPVVGGRARRPERPSPPMRIRLARDAGISIAKPYGRRADGRCGHADLLTQRMSAMVVAALARWSGRARS